MSRVKRHHFVPRFYLDRFAEDNRVLVRRRDGKIFEANPVNVAVESGFYDIADPEGGKSSLVEELLADTERAAASVIAQIDQAGEPPSEASEDRKAFAVFLALQATRTPEHRERVMFPERVAEWAAGREITQQLVAEFLEREHLGSPPSDNEAKTAFEYVSVALGSVSQNLAIETMLGAVKELAPRLASRHWTVEFDRKAKLITSDSPLVVWRAPTPRDQYEGIGIANAEELRFPLDPQKQLVLSDRKRTGSVRITPARARSCNQDAAAGCHRFIVASPRQASELKAVRLAKRRPTLRFHTGPLYEQGPNGTRGYVGEVMHMWVPRR